MARHHIQKDPDDFEAHYNLAAFLQSTRRVSRRRHRAFHRSRATSARPIPPPTTPWAQPCSAAGRAAESIPHLTAALKARPDYFDAHYNLGNALASQGDFTQALIHFRAAVRLNPDDANAEANLGSALAETGNIPRSPRFTMSAL